MHTLLFTPRKLAKRDSRSIRTSSSLTVPASHAPMGVDEHSKQARTARLSSETIKLPQRVYLRPARQLRHELWGDLPTKVLPSPSSHMESIAFCDHARSQDYKHDQYTPRMPDFLRRIFAPPNCLHPACDSDDAFYDTADLSIYSVRNAEGSRRQQNSSAIGSLSPSMYSRIPSALPWPISISPTMANVANGQQNVLWPILHGSASSPWSKTNSTISPRTPMPSKASYHADESGSSLYSSLTSVAMSPSAANNQRILSSSVISAQATARAELLQSQLERDIEDFLKTPLHFESLDAQSIIALCEAAGDLAQDTTIPTASGTTSHAAKHKKQMTQSSPAKRVDEWTRDTARRVLSYSAMDKTLLA